MNVLLFNGSPNEKGCTFTALTEIQKTLTLNDINSEIFWIGKAPIAGCIACGQCINTKKCIFQDSVNLLLSKINKFDGFIFGSPVYFSSPNGSLIAFLDRLFFRKGDFFANKPASAIVSCRRAGSTAALDVLNKYFFINKMPIVTSQYWNMVHGNTPSEVLQDLEGLQTMRTLAQNMVWLLKCIEAGKKTNIQLPQYEPSVKTNFIR